MSQWDHPVKMFIKDVHTMEKEKASSNYYKFSGQLIRKVDVMGVVTEVKPVHDAHLYRVDDGTGEILLKYEHHSAKHLKEIEEIEQLQAMVGTSNHTNPVQVDAAMKALLEVAYQQARFRMDALAQGDICHVQGFACEFHSRRELRAFKLCKVDVSQELDRTFELAALYSRVYT